MTKDERSSVIMNDKNDKYFENNPSVIDFTFETFYRGWHMGTQTLFFRKIYLESNYTSGYKHAKDIHLIAHLLKKGKGACLNFFGAIYRVHSGGVYNGATDLENAELSYKCYKEIYEQNKSILFLKLKYLLFAQNYIKKLTKHNKYIIVGKIKLELFFVPKN